MPPALEGAVVQHLKVRIRGLVPAAAVLQVKDEGRFFRGGERVAVDADALGGAELRRNAVAKQRNAVIPGLGDFLCAVCIGPHPVPGVSYLTYYRHDGNVEQVAYARTGKMRVAESDDGGIRGVVARAPVPRLRDAGRAQLYHSEGDIGSHEHVSVSSGPDARIYAGNQVLRLRLLRARGEEIAGQAGNDGNERCRVCHSERSEESHRILVFLVKSMISGIYPKARPVTVSAQP